jgi:hypothetical protein
VLTDWASRVGLLQSATLGQLTAAQLKNAFNILDVIAGISMISLALSSSLMHLLLEVHIC